MLYYGRGHPARGVVDGAKAIVGQIFIGLHEEAKNMAAYAMSTSRCVRAPMAQTRRLAKGMRREQRYKCAEAAYASFGAH
jgi:hypothetical protein